MFPKLISIGPFFIPTYGFFVACGVFLGLLVARKLAERDGLEGQKVFDLGLSIVLGALVGAKVALIFVYPGQFFHSFSSMVELLRSGGVFYGGFLGGLLTGAWLLRRHRLPLWMTADAIGVALPLGQAVGRLGCFSAGCCWGKSCDLPWSITFHNPFAHEITGVPLHYALHPVQLYLFMMNLTIFVLVLMLHRVRRFPGQVFWSYAWLYALGRFTMEHFRGDPRGFPLDGPFSTSQVIALLLFTAATFFLLRGFLALRRKDTSQEA